MRPIPQSLYDRAELLARSHELQVVAELLGKHPSTITRMKQRGWKAVGYPKRPIPADFAIQSRHMSFAELCEHYQAGTNTVARWLRERPRPSMKGRRRG